MARESIAQETAGTAPYGKITEHLLCGTCKREIVWDTAKGWVHKHDGMPHTMHFIRLPFTRPFLRGE